MAHQKKEHMPIPELGFIPSDQDFEAVLSFIPPLQNLEGAEIAKWHWKDANGVAIFPYAQYDSRVNEFVQALYDHGFIQQFDWPSWQSEGRDYMEHPEMVAKADLTTCFKLLTMHLRAERFCEGHLAEVISSGHIFAILQRLRELRAT